MIYFISFNIDPAIIYTCSTAEFVLNIVNDFGNCLKKINLIGVVKLLLPLLVRFSWKVYL